MKAVIVLIVLLGLVIAGVYFFGGYRNLDPDLQGNTLKAAIKPGMTWQQVLKLPAGDKPKFQTIAMVKERGGMAVPKDGPKVDLDQKKLTDRLKSNGLPDGFKFVYMFSEKVAFEVTFDGSGKVDSVQDVPTIADLLQTR